MSAMIIGQLRDMLRGRDGEWIVSFSTRSDFRETFDELAKSEVSVEIKKAHRRRSLTANAYAWVLLDAIAEKKNEKIVDVYRAELRDVGGVSIMLGIKKEAIETFRSDWESGHLGRQIEIVPGSQKEGWENIRAIRGSSEFDSAQMNRFISNLVQDAEALGIPTMTDREVEKLLGKWKPKTN